VRGVDLGRAGDGGGRWACQGYRQGRAEELVIAAQLLPTDLQRACLKPPTYCHAPCNEPLVSLPRGVHVGSMILIMARRSLQAPFIARL
jgi:hypothetical protein